VSAAVGRDGLLDEPTTYAWSVPTPVEVNKPIAAARKPDSVAADTPIIVPQIARRWERKWVRAIEDLPRSERWRRRLPDVCR
jgi:hypothetical protein